jgi:hypothetical protein
MNATWIGSLSLRMMRRGQGVWTLPAVHYKLRTTYYNLV